MSDTQIQRLLDLMQADHPSACNALLEHTLERMRCMAAVMFQRRGDLRRLNDTDEVLQRALLRLHKALQSVQPENVAAYFGLAARQIRWVLADMAQELAARSAVAFVDNPEENGKAPSSSAEPNDLPEWSEFHQKIEKLPAEEREMFDLLLYQGMSQPEAAALVGVALRTVKRRWQRARLLLRDALNGEWPTLQD